MSKQERHPESILMSFFLIIFIAIMIPLYIEMERERLEAAQAKGASLQKRLGICVDLLTDETFQQFLDTPTPKGRRDE